MSSFLSSHRTAKSRKYFRLSFVHFYFVLNCRDAQLTPPLIYMDTAVYLLPGCGAFVFPPLGGNNTPPCHFFSATEALVTPIYMDTGSHPLSGYCAVWGGVAPIYMDTTVHPFVDCGVCHTIRETVYSPIQAVWSLLPPYIWTQVGVIAPIYMYTVV